MSILENKILHELKQVRKENLLKKEIWSLKDFMLFTGYSESWIYKKKMNGEIPYLQKSKGAAIFFEREKIISWFKNNVVETDDEVILNFNNLHKS